MITTKSCLAIRSGRFNERNAMLKKYFMLLTACLFFTAAWLLFAAEAGALSFSQSTGLVSLKVTPEYKTLSPASETIDIIAEADINRAGTSTGTTPETSADQPRCRSLNPRTIRKSAARTPPPKNRFMKILSPHTSTPKKFISARLLP